MFTKSPYLSTSLYRERIPFEKRKEEADRIVKKYKDKVPIIVEKSANSKQTPNIDKNKFLVPNDLTLAQFIFIIRKRIRINPEQGLFVFIDNKLPNSSELMISLYEEYANADGMLYISYSIENTFGNSLDL